MLQAAGTAVGPDDDVIVLPDAASAAPTAAAGDNKTSSDSNESLQQVPDDVTLTTNTENSQSTNEPLTQTR